MDRFAHLPGNGLHRGKGLAVDPDPVANSALAKPTDGVPSRGFRRFGGDVALGVEAERPVVQIGRADPQHRVVIDRDLGVDDDPLTVPGMGSEGEEAIVTVGLLQSEQNLGSGRIHGDPVKPAGAGSS